MILLKINFYFNHLIKFRKTIYIYIPFKYAKISYILDNSKCIPCIFYDSKYIPHNDILSYIRDIFVIIKNS